MANRLTAVNNLKYQDIFLDVYELKGGIISHAFEELNANFSHIKISWENYYYKYWQYDDDFKTKLAIINAGRVNWVEQKMFERISFGDSQLIKFYLQSKGNYSEKTEQTVNHNINEPIKIIITKPDERKQ